MDDDILNDLAAEIANNRCVLFAGAGFMQEVDLAGKNS